MTVEPTLSASAKWQMGMFAAGIKIKYPQHKDDISALTKALQDKNAFPPDVRAKMVEVINKDPDAVKARIGDMIEKNPSVLKDFSKNPMMIAEAVTGKPMQPAPAAAPVVIAATPPTTAVNAPTATPPARPTAPVTTAPVTPPAAKPPVPVVAAQTTAQDLLIQEKILAAQQELAAVPGFTDLMDRAKKDPTLDRALTAMMGDEDQTPEQTLKNLTEFKDKLKAKPEGLTEAVSMYDKAPVSMREGFLSAMAEDPPLGRAVLAGEAGAKTKLMGTALTKSLGMDDPNNPLSQIFSMLFGGKDLSTMIARFAPAIERFASSIGNSFSGMAKAPGLMNLGAGGLLAGLLSTMSPNDPQIANKPITNALTGSTATVAEIRRTEPVEPGATIVVGPATPTMAKLDSRLNKGPAGMDGPGGPHMG